MSAPDLSCDISAAGEIEDESDDRSQNEEDSIMSDEVAEDFSKEAKADIAIAVWSPHPKRSTILIVWGKSIHQMTDPTHSLASNLD